MSGAAAPAYALDNSHPTSQKHHDGLERLLDPFTMDRIRDLGRRRPDGWRGARVLDIGAGYGSFARKMGDLVGPEGSVLALDLKPQRIEHPRVEVMEYDVTAEAPLPHGPFDLVHARLVLGHLPEREDVLTRMAEALAPGGCVLIEDWSPVHTDAVIQAPSQADAELYNKYAPAAGAAFASAGNDRTWARRNHSAVAARALVDVDTVVHAEFWRGGGPGALMTAAILPQLRPRLLAAGMTEEELDRVPALMENPELVIHPHLLYSTAGWKPLG